MVNTILGRLVKAGAARLLGLPEVKIINRDSEMMRAVLAENAELRRRLNLPLVSSIKCVDGYMSRVTHDVPVGSWVSQRN